MTIPTHTTTALSLERLRSRAALLSKDSLDVCIWAKQSGNAELQQAAAQFASARKQLYDLSNALLIQVTEGMSSEDGSGTE